MARAPNEHLKECTQNAQLLLLADCTEEPWTLKQLKATQLFVQSHLRGASHTYSELQTLAQHHSDLLLPCRDGGTTHWLTTTASLVLDIPPSPSS